MTMNDEDDDNPKKANRFALEENGVFWVFIIAFIFLGVTAVIYAAFFLPQTGGGISADSRDWAGFGNFFGGFTGPVISLFTLFVLVLAYLAQRQELAGAIAALSETNSHNKAMLVNGERQNSISAQQALNDSQHLHLMHLNARFQLQLQEVQNLEGRLRAAMSPSHAPGSGYHTFNEEGVRLALDGDLQKHIRKVEGKRREKILELEKIVNEMKKVADTTRTSVGEFMN